MKGLKFRICICAGTMLAVLLVTCKRDRPPFAPSAPTGPSYLLVNESDTFSVSTTDPQGDSVSYVLDWGDSKVESTGYYASGETARLAHSWSAAGVYALAVKAQDTRAGASEWSDNLPVTVGELPATPPAPTGPTAGSLNLQETFTVAVSGSKLGRDSLNYLFDWGDGTQDWSAKSRSGEPAQAFHSWSQAGAYDVKVRARDKHGNLSEWSKCSQIQIGLFPCRVIDTIPIGGEPIDITMSPSGEYVYISHYAGFVTVIRTSDNTVAATIVLPGPLAGIDASPNGEYVYVAGYLGSVYAIRTSDDSVVATIPVGNYLWGLKVSPNGEYVYATEPSINRVAVIRTSDNTVVALITPGPPWGAPRELAVSPDGNYVYVTDPDLDAVWIIRTADDSVVCRIQVGYYHGAWDVAFSADGDYAYVTGALNGTQVAKIKTSDRTYSYPISCVRSGGIAFLPSGDYVYVTRGSRISVIRTADDTVVADIMSFGNSGDVAVSPDGNRVYVVDAAANSCVSVLEY
jgi:DNA-binding beta-propeller fold protein YncE